jgi:hypothetical protein
MTAELLFDELGFIQSTYLGTLWYECKYLVEVIFGNTYPAELIDLILETQESL